MKQTQKMRSFFRNRVTKALGMTLALMMASQSALASLAADQTRYIFRGDKDALTITVTNNDKERTFGGQAWVDNIVEKDTRPTFVVTRLAAAYASAVSDFELRLPAENTPAQWQTGLSVTVTVQ
ncbi:fimbria/pilus periplasmic chaperone [Salmonella enterica subsp. enterica serovar Poona]|nr:fimbria/pilus periplasmic chaperone [Salmonella enterica]EDU9185621.1 fimbria/pilus periplasmic chaperone [Salmonella enterica subsp. enterica serovar Poona]ECR9416503.1 fimbria/pilus periplasmic chaperone [Salmonella enterica]EDC5820595.1 fimbria/pilus periplasmic chaperone [Salmonella enterica]EDK9394587.1 hypothetical protein [Salmonella enterica]